jgi:hypothetical protein
MTAHSNNTLMMMTMTMMMKGDINNSLANHNIGYMDSTKWMKELEIDTFLAMHDWVLLLHVLVTGYCYGVI